MKKTKIEIINTGFGYYLRYKKGIFGRWFYYKKHNQANIYQFKTLKEVYAAITEFGYEKGKRNKRVSVMCK